jgi:hypothetical protein
VQLVDEPAARCQTRGSEPSIISPPNTHRDLKEDVESKNDYDYMIEIKPLLNVIILQYRGNSFDNETNVRSLMKKKHPATKIKSLLQTVSGEHYFCQIVSARISGQICAL